MGGVTGQCAGFDKAVKSRLLNRLLPARNVLANSVAQKLLAVALEIRHPLVIERGGVGKNATLAKIFVGCIHIPCTEIEEDNKQNYLRYSVNP